MKNVAGGPHHRDGYGRTGEGTGAVRAQNGTEAKIWKLWWLVFIGLGDDGDGSSTAFRACEVAKNMNYAFRFDEHNGFRKRQTPYRIQALAAIVLTAVCSLTQAPAADLKEQTIQAWQEYISVAEARNQTHLAPGSSFLSIDAIPGQAARLRRGDVAVLPAAPNVPVKVPSGLVHDWTGAIFIPNVSLRDVIRVVRDYEQYHTVYHPAVVRSKSLDRSDWEDRFSMVVMNKSFVASRVFESDYRSTFTRLDEKRWYSTSESTRVQEILEYDSPSQCTLPEGHGTGVIWRLYSVARYEERDGGVYIELEAIALSRDIPGALRWLVDPIVRRVSQSSIAISLQQTAEAIRSGTNTAIHGALDGLIGQRMLNVETKSH